MPGLNINDIIQELCNGRLDWLTGLCYQAVLWEYAPTYGTIFYQIYLSIYEKEKQMDKEQVRQEAKHVADSLGLKTLKELYHVPVREILLALRSTLGYNNDETMKLIRMYTWRFAEEGYIPKSYVDDIHELLFSP